MPVAPIRALADLLVDARIFDSADTAIVFCYEQEHRQSVRTALQTIKARRVVIFVGAEGGFSPAEADMICAAGGQPVSLGRLILRAETAALTALAVTQYELGNL